MKCYLFSFFDWGLIRPDVGTFCIFHAFLHLINLEEFVCFSVYSYFCIFYFTVYIILFLINTFYLLYCIILFVIFETCTALNWFVFVVLCSLVDSWTVFWSLFFFWLFSKTFFSKLITQMLLHPVCCVWVFFLIQWDVPDSMTF